MELILLYNQYLSIVYLCEFKSIFPGRSIEETGRRIGPCFSYFHGPNLGAIFSCWDGEFVEYANGRNVQLHGWGCKRNGASVCLRVSTHARDTSVTVSLLSALFYLRLCLCVCQLFVFAFACACACVCAFVLHIRRIWRICVCVQIFFHEFRDGLRRLETTPQIQFTAEDWNTHVISRGLAMTDGQLDMQVPHVCLVCNKDLWRIVGVARLTRLSVQTFKTLISVHLKEVSRVSFCMFTYMCCDFVLVFSCALS